MEQARIYQAKLKQLVNAVTGFRKLVDTDISGFNEVIKDGIKNGQIQKFEYRAELLWKTMKIYLKTYHEIDAVSPREVITEYHAIKKIDEVTSEAIFEMIKDRNSLSHMYKENYYNEAIVKLPEYLNVMIKVIDTLSVN